MRSLFITGLCILIMIKVQAQSDQLIKRIDSVVHYQQWLTEVPGIAIGVIYKDSLIYKKTFGVQSLGCGQPISTISDFHMASVSKPFAATAILQLAEKGKIHLDSPVVHYLPYFKMNDVRYKNITLYEILTHSSGIPDVTDYGWNDPQYDDGAAERYTKSLASRPLNFKPGEKFSYSNAAFDILADLISKVSGLTFEQYISNNIFIPAGMNNTSFLLTDIPQQRRTAPHTLGQQLTMVERPIYPYNRMHAPSSTLHTNLEDILKWARVWLNNGAIEEHKIISDSIWDNMLQPRIKLADNYFVCLSWFTTKIAGKNIFFHAGGDEGYGSFVGFDPVGKMAVVIMGNTEFFNGDAAGTAIINAILSDKPLQLPPMPIYRLLKDYILTVGIAKTKQLYYREKKRSPHLYNFDSTSVAPLADILLERGYKKEAAEILEFSQQISGKTNKTRSR